MEYSAIQELRFDPPKRWFWMSGYGIHLGFTDRDNKTGTFGNLGTLAILISWDQMYVVHCWVSSIIFQPLQKNMAGSAPRSLSRGAMLFGWSEDRLNKVRAEVELQAGCRGVMDAAAWESFVPLSSQSFKGEKDHKMYPKIGCERKWFPERFAGAVVKAGFLVEAIKYSQVWDTPHRVSCFQAFHRTPISNFLKDRPSIRQSQQFCLRPFHAPDREAKVAQSLKRDLDEVETQVGARNGTSPVWSLELGMSIKSDQPEKGVSQKRGGSPNALIHLSHGFSMKQWIVGIP